MSTIPINTGRRFELVSDQEWDRIAGKKITHTDLHQAINYLKTEKVGTKVRVRCQSEIYRKKYYALKDHADRCGLNIQTKWDNNWLYVKKLAE